MRSRGTTAVAIALLLGSASVYANENPVPAGPASKGTLGLLLRMNFDFGGDRLVDVMWTDGESATLRAGQLITFAAGIGYRSNASWAIEATLGYKFDKVNGSNGTIEFTRVPVDIIVSWAPGHHRLGGGPTVHLAPTFNCGASGLCDTKVVFDPAFGGVVQYAYLLKSANTGVGLDLGVRYSFIWYSGRGIPTQNGSAFGFFFGFAWL
jgi:hypothetical protein